MVIDFHKQIASNNRKTWFLFIAFFLLISILSFTIAMIVELMDGGGFWIIFSLFGILTIIFAIAGYYWSDSIVTAVSGAKEAPKDKYQSLHNIVEELCLASGLPKPKIYVINDTAINAFAAGRNPEHAIICLTTGALTRLSREQIQGVVAHELSHIQNYDVRTMTVATVLVGMSVLLADVIFRMFIWGPRMGSSNSNKNLGPLVAVLLVVGIVAAIVTPIVANLIKLSISRKREFMADASAVKITRNPEGLASALEVISKDTELLEAANKATAHLYISNPLKGRKMMFKGMFSTHPPIQERISILRGTKV